MGQPLPDVALASTQGGVVNSAHVAGRAVYFIYTYTGKVGHPDPENWDHIAGAHGSTPQALAYAKTNDAFAKLNVKIFGVSLLSQEWQADFAALHRLPYPLLSDFEGHFSSTLSLPRFKTGGEEFLTRLTIIARDGIVSHIRFPVSSAQDDAQASLDILREHS